MRTKIYFSMLLMILSSMAPIASAIVPATPYDEPFTDLDEYHDNYRAVQYLFENNVVEGYSDRTYRPDQNLSRAEFLKIVMESSSNYADLSDKADCFDDVKGHWAENYICNAQAEGIIAGYPDGLFRPNDAVNFAESSKMITNVLDLDLETVENGKWYETYVESLVQKKAIPTSINAFDKDVTRGEMAEMVWRIEAPEEEVYAIDYQTAGLIKAAASVEEGGLTTFDSCIDAEAYFDNSSINSYLRDGFIVEEAELAVTTADSAGSTKNVAAPESSDESATSFSETNVQVKGVDEADIVKTDGSHIYFLKNNTLKVVDAYPADEMNVLDDVTFEDDNFYASDLYVDGDLAVVIGSTWGTGFNSSTRVYVLNIADTSNVEIERNLLFKGGVSTSRKVDDRLYLVMNDYIYNYYDDPFDPIEIMPLVEEDGAEVARLGCDQIMYYPGSRDSSRLIVAGFDVSDDDSEVSLASVVGASGNVYSSRDNLYIAEYGHDWWRSESENTIIHRFGLGEEIEYEGKGSVPGHLLNQFSMDESDGYFRVATTVGNVWDDENKSTNNIYVLDEDLEQVGEIEGIAPGEKIYSVRFMGDRAYMVTFKKVDPFFVIDLSDAENPEILGELKLPGYSDYLHPLDDDHVIGFGKDAVDASAYDKWNRDLDFAWYQGMKIAIFDVTDVTEPVVLDDVVIGDRGTDSELLYNHKALMFDSARGIMAFPIRISEIPEDLKNDPETPKNAYGEETFAGAIVFDVSVEDGLEERGRVTHNEEKNEWGYFDYNFNVLRALYLDDYLYTVSNGMIKANHLDDFEDEYSVKFENKDEEVYVWGE